MHPSSSSPSSSTSTLAWADWVPECLQPAIAIASEMPYHHHQLHDHDHDEDDDEADEEEVDEEDHGDEEEEDDFHDQDASPEEDDDEPEEDDLQDPHDQEQLLNYHFPIDGLRPQQFGHHRHLHHHPQPPQQLLLQQQNQQQQQQQVPHQQQQQHQQQQLGIWIPPSSVCLSCKETYTPRRAGTCLECYEEASETEEVLRKEIEELNARIMFLKTWAPEVMGEDCTDLVLESSDGSKVRAHQAVLVSRSSVFKAMLENEMEESRSGTIKITDFTFDVLKLFVHYLYTAEIYQESLEEWAFDLLALAEKYNVKHLKSVCERFMASKVNNDNALFNYEYASRHGAKVLKEAALSTILENIHELPAKEEYRHLIARDARLVVEIYEVYLAKQSNSSSRDPVG